jgi:hypothetical protein
MAKTSKKPAPEQGEQAGAVCRCNHKPAYLSQEIAARRWVHEYQESETGEYELICLTCGCLWDHRATDKLIEWVMKGGKETHRAGTIANGWVWRPKSQTYVRVKP